MGQVTYGIWLPGILITPHLATILRLAFFISASPFKTQEVGLGSIEGYLPWAFRRLGERIDPAPSADPQGCGHLFKKVRSTGEVGEVGRCCFEKATWPVQLKKQLGPPVAPFDPFWGRVPLPYSNLSTGGPRQTVFAIGGAY